MSNITQNLLSTYYGFGKKIENAKTLSIHDSINILTDDPNISLVDESLENEDQISTKEGSKEEDTNEQYEDGFSTLDEKSIISDEELVEDENFSSGYDNILETFCNENIIENSEIHDFSQEVYSGKLNKKIDNIEDKLDKEFPLEELNENKKIGENLSSCTEFSSKNYPCDGIFFDLSGTGISSFPKNMFTKFPNLKMLYLESNNLNQLPEELFTFLKFLQWLDVRNNRISFLPSSIKGHPNLETILIQRNKLIKLPLELGTLPKLKRLQTTHNPLIYPPKEILSQGPNEIIQYLREEWNKNHPEESVQLLKVSEEILPEPSTILCYQSTCGKKKLRKVTKIGSTNVIKLPGRMSVRKKTWNYKPSNRCVSSGSNECLETRLLWIEKAKEFLAKRASELQKLIDRSTLKNWRHDKSSFTKSMIKAANRTEDDIPFAVDSDTISISMKLNQNKKPITKLSAKKNRSFEKPISDINKNIDEIFESLDKLKLTEITESMTPRKEKKMLETEMLKIIDLQNSIKHLKYHNDRITAPFAGREINKKSYDFPPSIII